MGARRPAHHGRTEASPEWAHRGQPRMGTQRPAQNGRTEACPLWAYRGLPRVRAQRPAQHGRIEACPAWAHRGRPRMGAQRPAQNGRTEVCPPTLGARRSAQNERTEACPPWGHRGLPSMGAQKPANKEYRSHRRRQIPRLQVRVGGTEGRQRERARAKAPQQTTREEGKGERLFRPSTGSWRQRRSLFPRARALGDLQGEDVGFLVRNIN